MTGEVAAESAHGSVVAAGLAGQGSVSGGVDGLELGVRGFGLGGALGGLDPEDLQVGERGAELLLREGLALLELAQDGHHLVAQPALLGVGAQEQADVGERRGMGMVRHAGRPCLEGESGIFPASTGWRAGFRTWGEFPRFLGEMSGGGLAGAQAADPDLPMRKQRCT